MSHFRVYSGRVTRQPLRLAILEAERILAEAGVPSPRPDAEALAAHVLGVPRGKLAMTPLADTQVIERLRKLVEQRSRRIPLQHIVGTAVLGSVEVGVGNGVFVPRPETEQLLEWTLRSIAGVSEPLVFDLCTGSGALALAIAHERPDARVLAVEQDHVALAWARRNADARAAAGDRRIELHAGDVADAGLFTEFDGLAHLVVCNPPYVPAGAELSVEATHDPEQALFAGPDGLDVIRAVVRIGARLLREGGELAIEHDDSNGEGVAELLAARRVLTEVTERKDLAGKPRFVTAARAALST